VLNVSVRPMPASAFGDAEALGRADVSFGLLAVVRAVRSLARVLLDALAVGAGSGAFVTGATSTTGGAGGAGV
jgi:hypothetical protein